MFCCGIDLCLLGVFLFFVVLFLCCCRSRVLVFFCCSCVCNCVFLCIAGLRVAFWFACVACVLLLFVLMLYYYCVVRCCVLFVCVFLFFFVVYLRSVFAPVVPVVCSCGLCVPFCVLCFSVFLNFSLMWGVFLFY